MWKTRKSPTQHTKAPKFIILGRSSLLCRCLGLAEYHTLSKQNQLKLLHSSPCHHLYSNAHHDATNLSRSMKRFRSCLTSSVSLLGSPSFRLHKTKWEIFFWVEKLVKSGGCMEFRICGRFSIKESFSCWLYLLNKLILHSKYGKHSGRAHLKLEF